MPSIEDYAMIGDLQTAALVSRDNGQSFVPLATGTTKMFATAVAGARDQVLLIGETGARPLSLPAVK